MEVVIADDGSSDGTKEMIKNMSLPFNVKYVWQRDKGYRLSKIRNEGIRKTTHDTIIILDVDMIPTPGFVRQHMKWHHIAKNIGVIGHRRYVKPDDITLDMIKEHAEQLYITPDTVHARLGIKEDWRIQRYKKSRNLKDDSQPYRCFCGGNISFNKRDAFLVGLFDEEFQFWGGEDADFGNRLYKNRIFMIPELKAEALHLEHDVADSSKRTDEKRKSASLLEKKIKEYVPCSFDPPKVSIFIPTYNRERYVKESIESALAQTLKDLEIVVCDDGSTDRTPQILKELQEKYNKVGERPLIRVVRHQHNKGISAAWNTAITNTRGKYILQLDSDDIIKSDTAEKLAKILDTNFNVVCAYGNLNYFDEKGQRDHPGWNRHGFDREYLFNVCMCIAHPRMFRASAWFKTEGADEDITNAVDYDAMIKLAEQGDFYHLEELLYYYRWHGKQTSVEKRKEQRMNARRVMDEGRKRRGEVPQKKFYVVNENDKAEENLFRLGIKQREKREYKSALDTFSQIINQNPYNIEAYVNIGMTFRDMGQKGLASNYFEKALQLNSNHQFAKRNLEALSR